MQRASQLPNMPVQMRRTPNAGSLPSRVAATHGSHSFTGQQQQTTQWNQRASNQALMAGGTMAQV